LEKNRAKLKKIAKLLLEKEVISSDEINAIAKIKKPKGFKEKAEIKALPPLEKPEPAKV
jgi:hypothetical protein